MYEYKFVNIQNADPAKEIVARNLSSAIFNSAPSDLYSREMQYENQKSPKTSRALSVCVMVISAGFEPATPTLSRWCSPS